MATKLVTGSAVGKSGREAAKKAASEAMAKLDGAPGGLALLFCSSGFDYETVLQEVNDITGGMPLIGCSTAGEFSENAVHTGGLTLGVLVSDGIRFHTTLQHGLRKDLEAAVKRAAADVPERVEDFPNRCALAFIDGLAGVGEQFTALASCVFGPEVKIVGGAAGDDFKMERTVVFCGDSVASDAVALCMCSSKAPFFTALKHGHRPLSKPLTITKAAENVLYEIDGRPAWTVWREETKDAASTLGLDVSTLQSPAEIGRFFANFQLGLSLGGDQYKVRWPSGVNSDGSITFTCTIAEGSVFRIMDGSRLEDLIQAAGNAAKTAFDSAQNQGYNELAGSLLIECGVRALMLKERFPEDIAQFKVALGDVPLVGCETYGELCLEPTDFSGYHNTTSVAVLIPQQ